MYSSVICKLAINDILMSFLHCKALRTAMYKRYINSIIIIIIIENGTVLIWMDNPLDFIHLFSRQF